MNLVKSLLTLILSIAALASPAKAEERPPNIIFILADDLGYGDLGCYGQTLIKTPNIDRLAASGIRFTQAYAGGPVCTPSRSVLMTGLHSGHTPARDNVPHYTTYLKDEDITVAEVLKESGYRCGGSGKWSLGDAGTTGRATNQGFDTWFGYLNQDHAHYYFAEYLDDDEKRFEIAKNTKLRSHYSHDLLTEHALEFIRESKDKPFFYYAAYTLPHFSSKEEDKDGLAIPSTEPYSDNEWEEKAKKYAAMIHRIDRDVGRIVDQVDQLNLSDNTLIIFTSDNGGHSTVAKSFDTNGPLRGYKRDLTEGGIRVPFIARWPGTIPKGVTSDEVIAFQDMMPTFAEIGGAKIAGKIDGISVVNALKHQKMNTTRDYLYWDYGHCRRYYDQAVRLNNWKGIRLGKESGKLQLYDLKNDIGEEHNLAEKHPDVVKQIETIMDTAATPNNLYPVGEIYTGKPVWKRKDHGMVELPALVSDDDPAIESSGFIFDPKSSPTPTCHSSTIVETPNGLVAAWFGGTKEPHIDNSIWLARQVDGEWTKPVEVVTGAEGKSSDHRTGNPVLFQPDDGPLMLFYKVVNPEIGRASHWWGMLTVSSDNGLTWADPWKLGQDEKLGPGNPDLIGPVKNKPIQLADGSILCPSSTEHDGWKVHFERTSDFGKTWEVIGPIDTSSLYNAIQPSLLIHPNDTYQILCRSKERILVESWSTDGGKTWRPLTASNLPNPNSGTDAVTLKDGRHLVIYNHSVREKSFKASRGILNLAISDDGKTWKPIMTLEDGEEEFSYPAIIQTKDGKIHITYTWKRESIRHAVLNPGALD
ncbi:MAG: exo-alpha-sialidase [Verrucomicrobiales bacterium]|nr:exo-alpha-sialidase [Verrucomicrobiales bacterium]